MITVGPYSWDEAKRAANLQRHAIDFKSIEAFQWEAALIWRDTRRDYGERRFLALGKLDERVHVLVYTPRGGSLRIISLRKANQREVKRYEKSQSASHSRGR